MMLDTFQKQLAQLADKDVKSCSFLLAVSGGLDSVVIAELFRLGGYNYSVAHCNFQLRGKESEEDEKFVQELTKKHDVKFFSTKFETTDFCNEYKVSVQMGARQLRYEWLEEIRQQNKFNFIVTAHHADDAIETFFINLFRGTGLSGLHGIKGKNENIIRPMLDFYRSQIEAFAKENKLIWREDSSNETDKYERNKIRHHLIPLLTEITPKAKESIRESMENLARTEMVLNDALEQSCRPWISTSNDRINIDFRLFDEVKAKAEYLYEIIKEWSFNYEQCKQISETLSINQPGKVFLSATHRMVIDRDKLIIEPNELQTQDIAVKIDKEQQEISFNASKLTFNITQRDKNFVIPTQAEVAALDFDKLEFPLTIRKWQPGDRFHPLGMKQAKKVSDFLVDNKVSLTDKNHVYVLLSGDDVVWLVGYRPDDRYKITEATKKVYLCLLQKLTAS